MEGKSRSEQIKQSLNAKLQLAVQSVKIQSARLPTETEIEQENLSSVKDVADILSDLHKSSHTSAMDFLVDLHKTDTNDTNLTHLTEIIGEPEAIHNTQESQSLIFDRSKLKTELQTHSCKTVHKIVQGFWMKGDFCVFITFDRVQQHYYLELFNKTQEGPLDTVQIVDTHEMITFYVEKSFDQSYTAILCEYQNQLTSRSCKLKLFVLKSEGFINGKIKNGLRSLDENDCLLLSNGEMSTTGSHLMLFSQCDNSLKILYQHEKKQEGKKKPLVMAVMTQLSLGILYTPGSEATEAITSPRINSKISQRKKKMIGFFYSHWHQIFVYQDGFIQMLKMRKMEIYSSELVLPFKNAQRCFFTKIKTKNESPVLIFQSKNNQVQAYLFDKHNHLWNKYFGFDQNAYEIQKAYGNYLIVKSLKDRKVKLLELGGLQDNQIVTEMDLGLGPQPYLQVESCASNQTLAVFYERHSDMFYWRWFDQHRQIFHFPNKTVSQLCGNLLIQIELGMRSNKLIVIDLNTYEQDIRAQLFSITLPESHSQISTFYPVMSPCNNYIALAMSFELGTALEFHNNKYQDVIILSLKEKLPIQVPSMHQPFSKIFFRSSSEILCQNDGGLISVHIEKMVPGKNDNDSDFVSEDEYGSLEFVGSPTKLERNPTLESDLHQTIKSKFLPSFKFIKSANYNVGCNFQRIKFECKSSKLIHVEQDFMLVLNGEQRAVYRVDFDSVSVIDVTTRVRRSTLKRTSFTPDEKILHNVCTLKVPNLPDTTQKIWDTCFSEEMTTMYVLLSTWNLSWVYKYIKKQGCYDLQDADIFFFSVKHAFQIFRINDEQLGIQTIDGIAVVNLTTRQVDFKFFFINKMNVEVTASPSGYVCVPRLRNGVMFKIGSNFSDCLEMHLTGQDENQFPSLNCIKNSYQLDPGYYLNIDEERVDWSSRHKFLPITIMSPDYVLKENGLPSSYNHMELFFVLYQTDFNIFDSVIRDGLMTGKVEISNEQLNRICNPVLADRNRNLLFHLVQNHGSKSLIKLFGKTIIADYFNLRTKRFAFFFDFDQLTVFDTALDNEDFQSFNILLNQLIIQQNGFQSNCFVGHWILKAMKHDLDLKILFQSQIFTQKITSDISNFAQYPLSHHKADTMTKCLNRDFPFTQIFRSNEIYEKVFGKEFGPADSDKSKNNISIQYHLDLLFIKNKKAFIDLLELLAKTNNMSYLNTEYIQRFVAYNWDIAKFYFITIFAFHTVSFSMIITSACLINSSDGSPEYEARWAINYANMVLVFGFLAIEVKQMRAQRRAYLKDVLNYNDLFFIFAFYTTMICDWQFGAVASQGTAEITRICYVVLTLSSFVKFLSLAQVFDRFSFIVKMVREVIIQIQPFMGLFLIFLVFFAVSVSVQDLQYDPALEGSGLTADTITAAESQNPFYGMEYIQNGFYLTMTSLGSYNVNLFKDKNVASRDLMWVIWLLIVLIQTIVFMNFLVAVIGDVYAKTIQHKTEEVFQKKAQLVVEFEYMKSKAQRDKNPDQFLFLTRKSFLTADSGSQAWQGSLTELKKLLIYQQQQIQIQVQQIFRFSFRNSETQMQEIKQGVSQLNIKFDQILKMHSELELIRILVEAVPNLDADKIFSEIQHEWNDSFRKLQTFRSFVVSDDDTELEDEGVMLARQLSIKARQQAKSLPVLRYQDNSLQALFK